MNTKLATATLFAVTLGLGLAACNKKEETPMENATEAVKDGLDMRPNEGMKDAGEDLGDAMKDAGAAVKDGAHEAGHAMKSGAEATGEAMKDGAEAVKESVDGK